MNSCYPGCCPPPPSCCVPAKQIMPNVCKETAYTVSACTLECMPQCTPPCPPATHRNVVVQQPPHLVQQKKVVYMNKVIQDPKLLYRPKPVAVPHVTETMHIRRRPVLRWVAKAIDEPVVTYHVAQRPDPYVVCCPRTVLSPKEVCETLICQPKPQVVGVPPPQAYSCYETGPVTLPGAQTCLRTDCAVAPPLPPPVINPCWPQNPNLRLPGTPWCGPY